MADVADEVEYVVELREEEEAGDAQDCDGPGELDAEEGQAELLPGDVVDDDGGVCAAYEEEDAGVVEVPEDELGTWAPVWDVVEAAGSELEELADEVDEDSEVEGVEAGGENEGDEAKAAGAEGGSVDDST